MLSSTFQKPFIILSVLLVLCQTTYAQRGGAREALSNRGGGGGGGNRPAAPSRPSSSPNLSRPSAPASRPNINRPTPPAANRPAPSRPNTNNISRPSPPPVNRPAPNRPEINRPNIPNINRPTGGMNPSFNRPDRPTPPSLNNRPGLPERPNFERPNASVPTLPTRPTTRPDLSRPTRPEVNRPEFNRPGTLPGTDRPITRPNPPNIDRPVTRPNPPSVDRPGTRPDLPNINRPGTRPELPNIDRPGTRPALPGGERPGFRPGTGGGRPGSGDLGDFLGIDRPLRPETLPSFPNRPGEGRPGWPERPTRPSLPDDRPTRPEFPNRPDRPGLPGDWPGSGDRPTRPEFPNRPDFSNRPDRPNRPGDSNRPGGSWNGQRPDWINNNNRPNWSNNIHRRPSWVNIDNSVNIRINNRWTNVVNQRGPNFVTTWPQNRSVFWNGWGVSVRRGWSNHHFHWYFNDHWWMRHPHVVGGWHYSHRFPSHPWNFWWSRPAWPVMQTWFVWAPRTPQVWQNPVMFDYGTGGIIYIVDNRVMMGGQEIATTAEFAMSAAELATVPPPPSVEQSEAAEWLPLGTFALSTSQDDVEPTRIVQLAVNREGIVSGTMFNTLTEVSQTIQGQVDAETQRVAFRIGESETLVAETGLYNLTQDEVPLWVHFGPYDTEVYLLVRLEYEDDWE